MTSVFSAIAVPQGYSIWRLRNRQARSPKASKTTSSKASCGSESDTQLAETTEEPDLRELNNALEALTALFPDVQPEVFREMLSSFQEESRLHVVVDQLLKHKAKWVQGRWRIPREHEDARQYKYRSLVLPGHNKEQLPQEERFRTNTYKEAVKSALYQEFKGLSHSTVRAVLAEFNYSYTRARPTLLAIRSKSWKFSVFSFLTRRKAQASSDHPLILWEPSFSEASRQVVPRIRPTGNPELDRELYMSLVSPLEANTRNEQEASDRALAEKLNKAQAEDVETLYDCQCCFTATTFEQLSACDDAGHFVCFRCICHAVKEALYGQGWARNFDTGKFTVRCLAADSNFGDGCLGLIPQEFLKRALAEGDDKGAWTKLEEKAAEGLLTQSETRFVRCPFCSYAEVDDVFFDGSEPLSSVKTSTVLRSVLATFFLLHALSMPLLFAFFWSATGYLLLANFRKVFAGRIPAVVESRKRIARKRRGLKFVCRSPRCGKSSCMHCFKEWRDIHVCFESEQIALRSTIELATAEAIKRTCPRCNLSFIKSSGCNKLTCVCGYHMCYVCREKIGDEGYGHFCEHFRSEPGKACAECDKCDLYKTEDEDLVIKAAAEKAEKRWLERETAAGNALDKWNTAALRARDRRTQAPDARNAGIFRAYDSWDDFLDTFIEIILE